MTRALALIVSLATALPARAAETFQFRFSGRSAEIDQARKAMGKWLKTRAKKEFPAKLAALSKNRSIVLARRENAELRDAVNSSPSGAAAPAETNRARTAADVPCASLELCPVRASAARADGASTLPDAAAALVQPWLLLQQRRGGAIVLGAQAEDPDVLATMKLEGLVAEPIELLAAAGPDGGFQLWLRSAADLDDIYAFSRESVLHPSEPR